MSLRFTLDGDAALEQHLSGVCLRVREAVKAVVPTRRLEGIVLGGGYGRGQGGVLRQPEGDRPYNDLEFYVFLRGNRLLNELRYGKSIADCAEPLSELAGVHVEFKVDSLDRLRSDEVSMFSYDLVSGHKIIAGEPELFAGCERHLQAENISAAEATRLVFNRCSGLLLAKNFLRQPGLAAAEADFIGRNIAKAQLGLGDAVLTVFGKYNWDCRERHRRLEKLVLARAGWLCSVRDHHARGLDFKLHPWICHPGEVEDLRAGVEEICGVGREVWLWLESRRLRRGFASPREYALSNIEKLPGTAPWRNLALNCRALGWQALHWPHAWRYPRERLFEALSLLLWETATETEQLCSARLRASLGVRRTEWQDMLANYQQIWRRCG